MKLVFPGLVCIWVTALVGCASSPTAPSPGDPVTHVVVVWLKQPGDEAARRRLIEVSESFRTIPGVTHVAAGRAIASERPQVDDSFDVAVVMTFRDRAALDAYQTHPAHRRAVHEVLAPLSERVVIYDLDD